MSAYIVEDKTINRVVTSLEIRLNKSSYLKKELEKLGYDTTSKNWRNKLANNMMKLNRIAVNYRYDGKGKPSKVKFQIELCSDVQVLKSLQCWTYQCSEGAVPTYPLFMFLENDFEKHLMNKIIDGMDLYKKAEWG